MSLFTPGSRYPLIMLGLLVITTVCFCTGLDDLRINPSIKALVPTTLQAEKTQQDVEGHFGSQQYAALYLEGPQLYEPETLRAIKGLIQSTQSRSTFERTASLFNTTVPYRRPSKSLGVGPLLKTIPDTREEVKRRFRQGRTNPLLNGYLIGQNRPALSVNFYLDPDRSNDPTYLRRAHEQLSKLARSARGHLDRAFFVGLPRGFVTFGEHIKNNAPLIGFLSLLLFVGLIGLAFQSFAAVVVPLVTSVASIVWTLGFMGWVGYDFTLFSWIIPVFLIVIGSTEDVHIISGYNSGRSKGNPIDHLNQVVLPALILTSFTTSVGFFSLLLNNTPAIAEFGLSAGVGMVANFLITILAAPALLTLLNPRLSEPFGHGGRWLYRLSSFMREHALTILVAALVMLGLSVVAATQVKVSNTVQNYLPDSSDLARDIDHFQTVFAPGSHLVFRLRSQTSFTREKNLRGLQRFEQFLDRHELVQKTTGFYDYVRALNIVLAPSEPPGTINRRRVEQYLLITPDQALSHLLSQDRTETLVIAHQAADHSTVLRNFVRDARRFLTNTPFHVHIAGSGYVLLQAADHIVRDQLTSAALLVGVLFVVLCLYTRRLGRSILLLLPNLLPVMVLFGAIGALRTPIDIALTMIGVIVFGIAVDDTLHMVAYWQSQDDPTVIGALRHEVRPVSVTSIGIILGALSMVLSFFPAIRFFGICMALAIMAAWAADLLLVPLILERTRKTE